MKDPNNKKYYHSEEQVEAHKLEASGKAWGNAYCSNLKCCHQWIAVIFKEKPSGLQCPECRKKSGTVLKIQKPL